MNIHVAFILKKLCLGSHAFEEHTSTGACTINRPLITMHDFDLPTYCCAYGRLSVHAPVASRRQVDARTCHTRLPPSSDILADNAAVQRVTRQNSCLFLCGIFGCHFRCVDTYKSHWKLVYRFLNFSSDSDCIAVVNFDHASHTDEWIEYLCYRYIFVYTAVTAVFRPFQICAQCTLCTN